ncbi:hypothetical protein M2399_005480 [Pseudomonas sp. BIGb0450]|uniref:hypothetical protein n=1 Tax=unclassified Pseudomonas TaxID=196821 RepID=UPI002169C8BB|nr:MULTISPECIES: hypothetical protein [unclassified Pseudomonas]MCS3420130.1 hypothetical protein [Pseudomonas sp. BIGb0558]MCS3440020.1 hypothetical protein [Pseudomonas sp. BIGb0450]
MTFQLIALPDLRTLASALRAKLCREPVGFSPTRSAFVTSSPRACPAPLAHWRICPTTGHLVQQWDHADPQDPQRRNVSSLVAQASLMLSLYVDARAA